MNTNTSTTHTVALQATYPGCIARIQMPAPVAALILYVRPRYYPNGRLALELMVEEEDGDTRFLETYAVVTINIPEEPLDEGEVIVKNYSENEGLDELLINNEILVDPPERIISLGYVKAPIHKITPGAWELIQKLRTAPGT